MILFQEQMRVRDDTLDPAYFARVPRKPQAGTGEAYDDSELREIIKNLQITINNMQNEINELKAKQVHTELTEEEYAALSEEEKAKDMEYFVVSE